MNALQKIAHAKAEKASILDLSEMALTELPKSIGDLIHLKQLNLSKNNLQRLPSEIGKLKNLERLNAWSNSLQELPRELGSLKNLKQLDLEDNHLIEIPRAVFELTALRILDVEHNTILEIPDEIQKLSALQQLDISRNKLQKVNARIGKLTYLSVLNLKGNLLRELPRALCDMRRLRQLSIEGNFLEEALVEASFEGQKAVQRYFREKYILDKIQEAKEKELIKLDLSNLQITDIPNEVFKLKSLKILGLDGNNIWDVPSQINQLKALEVIDLSNNQLVEIPEVLNQMKHLKVIETMGNPLTGSGILPKVKMLREEIKNRLQEVRQNHSEVLDLSDCGLSVIPAQVMQMTFLKKLILGRKYKKDDDFRHRNYLTALPVTISKLSNLQHLDVTGNALTNLPESIGELKQLQSINLSQNQFRRVPKVLEKLQFNLKALNLSENILDDLPKSFSKLKHLEKLNLSRNEFEEFPVVLGELPQLRMLVLTYNKLESLSDDIGNMPLLQSLNLSNNRLRMLPKAMAKLSNIKELNVSNNQLTGLFGNIHLMRFGLLDLNISNNKIKKLPVGVRQLIKLQTLNAHYNQLNEFPSDVLELKQLKKLSLHHNKIRTIPEGITLLKSLDSLDLTHNPLHKSMFKPVKKGIVGLREWFNFRKGINKIQEAKVNDVAELDLSNLGLRSIPREVFELKNLKVLRLGRFYGQYENTTLQNGISHLTKSFLKLESLEELYLENNEVVNFPEELLGMPNIRVVNLAYNQLKRLPNSIGQMTNLEVIDVNHNQLKYLPYEMAYLTNLKEVHLTLNPFQPRFKEVVELDLLSLKAWLAKELANKRIAEAAKNKSNSVDLSNCQMKDLPEQLFTMTKIKHLNLSSNHLSVLPAEISQFSNLETLNISDNAVENLPLELVEIKSLKKFEYKNNPLTELPNGLASQGVENLMQWLTQQSINQKIETITQAAELEEQPLYKRDAVICQVCHGSKALNGKHKYLGIQFFQQVCYGCQGLGAIDYESEQVHLILHNAHTHIQTVEKQLKHIIQQKKSFEESILFSSNTKHSALSKQIQKGFHNILERYNIRLNSLVGRHEFYRNVQERLHSILYNQYMLFCTMEEFHKLGNLESGMALDFEEKAAMQKGIIEEVEALNQYVSNADNLLIPDDFSDIVNDLAERFKQYS
ncbi:MAG: leucine-rich repeat domain-containing protein [Saprospiraceae bacterium]